MARNNLSIIKRYSQGCSPVGNNSRTRHGRSLPCRARFSFTETVRKARSMLRETPCSPPASTSRPHLTLHSQPTHSAESMLPESRIRPAGEGYCSSLCGFHVTARMRPTYHIPLRIASSRMQSFSPVFAQALTRAPASPVGLRN